MTAVRKVIVDRKRYGPRLQEDEGSILLWKRVSVKDFNGTVATTVNYDITGIPGGLIIEGAFVSLVQVFAGGGSASTTLSAGSTGTADAYIAATSVFTGVSPGILVGKTLVPGTALSGATTPTGAATIRIALVCNTNCSVLTTGKADFYFRLRAASIRTT